MLLGRTGRYRWRYPVASEPPSWAIARELSSCFLESPYCDAGRNTGSCGGRGPRALKSAGEAAVDSQLLAAKSVGAGDQQVAPEARSGAVPPLADCFSARPETGAGLVDALAPGQVVVLTGPEVRRQLYDWPGGTGKTQLAAYLAESAWQARQVGMLVWVTATSRASVLAGYAQAFAETKGAAPAGDAETAAARLVGWLATTSRPWLVVLDDVTAPADLDGLWPEGPAGRVLITTRNPAVLKSTSNPLVFPIGVFSSHEALTYLMGRLSTDPDQRIGAVDLLEDLGREPLALAQASATIASSGLSCRDYRDLFARSKEQIAKALGGEPSAKAVTWTLSVEQADQLSPGRLAQSCLALSVLLDCHGIPGDVFSTPAACAYIGAGAHGAGGRARPEARPQRPAQPGAHRLADHRPREHRAHGAGAPGRADGGQVGHARIDAGRGGEGGGAGAAAGVARRWRAAPRRRRAALLRGQSPAGRGRAALGRLVPCHLVPGRAEPGQRRAGWPRRRSLAGAGLGLRTGARIQPHRHPDGRRPAGQRIAGSRAGRRGGRAPPAGSGSAVRCPGARPSEHDHRPGRPRPGAPFGRAARGRDHRPGGDPGHLRPTGRYPMASIRSWSRTPLPPPTPKTGGIRTPSGSPGAHLPTGNAGREATIPDTITTRANLAEPAWRPAG